jgi:ferredoxin-NADP reductase
MRFKTRWRQARLRSIRDLAVDIRLFEIEPAGGPPVPFPPGAHLCIGVMVGERPDTRRYSLVGLPRADVYRIAVKRQAVSRGGSAYLWSLEAGARLSIADPQTLFEPDYAAREALLIAGGIGITPLVGMAEALARRGVAVHMIYAGRTLAGMPFRDELAALLGERLTIVTSAEGDCRRMDLAAVFAALNPAASAMICGPMPMIEAARRAWRDAGRPASGLRFETFGSSGHHPPAPFTVRVGETGQAVTVPADMSMLDALAEAGVEVMSDCRRGECGLCAVDIVAAEGTIDHRDVFFDEHQHAEARKICACVSRLAGGTITIDTGLRQDAI